MPWFSLAIAALLVWTVVLGLPIMWWDRRRLQRDPRGWLRRRNVSCEDDVEPAVLWVRGGVGGTWNLGHKDERFGFQQARLTAAVVTPTSFVVESQWPLVPWRRRLVIEQGLTLRNLGGKVADPKRRCLVESAPPEHLISVLRASGWELEPVPF